MNRLPKIPFSRNPTKKLTKFGMDSQHKTHRGPGIKEWRLIIRNLAFNTKETDVRECASQFGHILEVVLPKCKDKRFPDSCSGFCFIQFSSRKDAEKAKMQLNFTLLKGRKVAVDWALDKDRYVTQTQEAMKLEVKAEIKTEGEDVINGTEIETKVKNKANQKVKKNKSKKETKTNEQNAIKEEPESETETEEKAEEEKEKTKHNIVKKKAPTKSAVEDNAVSEGRVVFLRNVSFIVDDEKLKEFVGRFGEISLAILCRHKDTGEPTGTAFVHFRERESADAFLDQLSTTQEDDGLLLAGRRIFGHRAVQRIDAKAFNRTTEKKPATDKRNLYLLRTSLIRPGTAEAKGMSEKDAKARERLMETARNKLKNLVMFVSPTRLAIHNIPFSFTDAELKQSCLNSAGCPPSAITECRIMREKYGEDAKGRAQFGRSKGFGFVEFTEHTLALNCLRKMNNDPRAFTEELRPIVEFSIENLNALRSKERRQKQGKDAEEGDESDKANEGKKKSYFGKEEEAVEKTKREMMAGGKKWLPKKFGPKLRHRKTKIAAGETKKRKRGNSTKGGDDGQKQKQAKRRRIRSK